MNDAPTAAPRSFTTRLVASFLEGNFSLLLIGIALGLGALALGVTPREEDPQIEVPFVDVHLSLPLANPAQAERLGAEPVERLLAGLPGVEHVYSIAREGGALVSVRFQVGHDREKALLDVQTRLAAARSELPAAIGSLEVRPVEIDDVPILVLSLFGPPERAGELREIAEEVQTRLAAVHNVSKVEIVGGEPKALRVVLDPTRLAASGLGPGDLQAAIQGALGGAEVGRVFARGNALDVELGPRLEHLAQLKELIVSRPGEPQLQLQDLASIELGPRDSLGYHSLSFGPSAPLASHGTPVRAADLGGAPLTAVSLAIAKRRGTNAVQVAEQTLARAEGLFEELLPQGVGWRVLKNAGETAQEKVQELIGHLLIAIGTIALLVGGSLGWRAALVVAMAVPLTLALTLFADLLVGYTINRVTLFALILALGLLVDDPIVDVENIHRHLSRGTKSPKQATLDAVDEVRPPVILATLAVIASFLPMFFVSGMMGPYMRPMPFNVPMAMAVSLAIAFTVTPWAALHLLKAAQHGEHEGLHKEGRVLRGYRRLATLALGTRRRIFGLLAGIGLCFAASLALVGLGWVPLKMLPYDNKSELQLVLDAPEGTPLERTHACAEELAQALVEEPWVSDVAVFSGHPSPHDFNGLVRHHFLRQGSELADLRVTFAPRGERSQKAHALTLALRPRLEEIARRHGMRLKLVEPPPGPPVLAGLVGELEGPATATASQWRAATLALEARFSAIDGLRDVDSFLADEHPKLTARVDSQRAHERGYDQASIASAVSLCLQGLPIASLQDPTRAEPLPIWLEWPRDQRSRPSDLFGLLLPGRLGPESLPLADLVRFEERPAEAPLYRKDQHRLQYVTAEPVGLTPVEAVLELNSALQREPLPAGFEVNLSGEGEWQVTVDVFRDLGLAFAAALALIYVLLVFQTKSFALSALMMLAIPLTLIGVFPGFALLNLFFGGAVGAYPDPIYFTATAMIGVIALAGIVVRNSIILIDFMETGIQKGLPPLQAAIDAGAVRLRPILLTAGAAVLGAWVIVFDPIFSGLAWAFVFGIVASTAFSLLVVPAAYVLVRRAPAGSDLRT